MKFKPVVPLLLIGMLVAVIAILFLLLRDPGHAIVVPLQVRPATDNADRNHPESAKWQKRLLELAQSSPTSPQGDEDELERALRRYLALPPASRNADNDATASGLAADRIAHHIRHGAPERAQALCLHFRWSAIRINALAPVCRQTLSSGRQTQDTMIQTHHRVLLIDNEDGDTRRAAERYLENPYDGERLADLPIRLARGGEPQAAQLLLQELMQIDRMAAARLEHQLAVPLGVTHQGHPFEFED
jgi:hypothetical protein